MISRLLAKHMTLILLDFYVGFSQATNSVSFIEDLDKNFFMKIDLSGTDPQVLFFNTFFNKSVCQFKKLTLFLSVVQQYQTLFEV